MNLKSDIQELGELVRRLREADKDLRVFGADSHDYEFNATLTEAELQAFEAAHGITLPADYRLFLREVGDGGAGPYHGLEPLEESCLRNRLSEPFPFTQAPPGKKGDINDYSGILNICHQGCGMGFSYLVVTGPARGTVWDGWERWGMNFEPTEMTFSAWYRSWAEKALQKLANESLVRKLAMGMTKEQIIEATGGDWKERKNESCEEYYFEASEIPAQLILSGENGIVKEVKPSLVI